MANSVSVQEMLFFDRRPRIAYSRPVTVFDSSVLGYGPKGQTPKPPPSGHKLPFEDVPLGSPYSVAMIKRRKKK